MFIKKVFLKAMRICSAFLGYLYPIRPVLIKLSAKPRQVNFAVTNACNANCIFCAYRYMKRQKSVMPVDLFKKALADFVDIGGGDVAFIPVVGDAFLDPYLLERIRYARSFSRIKNIGLLTNGIAIDKFSIKDILSSGVSSITVSFGGFNRDFYKKIFGVDQFQRALENIVNLASLNRDSGYPVRISLALRIDKPLGLIRKDPIYQQLAVLINDITYSYKFDSWSGRIKQNDLTGVMRIVSNEKITKPCSMLYADGPTVLEDGRVTVCGCRDLADDDSLILGNIRDESLISLWGSEKLKRLREGFYKADIPALCRECGHYASIDIYRRLHSRKMANQNYIDFCNSDYYKRKKQLNYSLKHS